MSEFGQILDQLQDDYKYIEPRLIPSENDKAKNKRQSSGFGVFTMTANRQMNLVQCLFKSRLKYTHHSNEVDRQNEQSCRSGWFSS